MTKKVFFNGTGFDATNAIQNANRKADAFLNANLNRTEVSRQIIHVEDEGGVFVALLELTYVS